MDEEIPLGSEPQFMESFMTMRAMVEEMYREFKKGQGESTSTPKQYKGAEEPSLDAPDGKGKGEKLAPSSPPPSPHHSHLLALKRKRRKNL